MRWIALLLTVCACSSKAADVVVTKARAERAEDVARMYRDAGLAGAPTELFVRAFKAERTLELWGGARGKPLRLLRTFALCGFSGELGPKRARGDLQIPEGLYRINVFNPRSQFHLSLGIDYPNQSDRIRTAGNDPGGEIFLHGGCATIGCLPIGDAEIEVLYLALLDVRSRGQQSIAVHIFPTKLAAGWRARVAQARQWFAFWDELERFYEDFEQTRRPPRFRIHPRTGAYVAVVAR
jgi:murein L,D-transpeptidase YafK